MDKELNKLQGKWELISLKKDGIAASAHEIFGAFVVFADNRFVETTRDFESLGRILLRPGVAFFEIDVNISVNCACEKHLKGIYAWEGDSLKMCFSENDAAPDSLDSRSGTGWTLKVFRKVK